eukprot:CAMPEP_0118920700 /NCGR_PEP_ID=MMETSP1169-20130426/137_1 /TAXON_ID=36882 /ORGANISM="Pyramimonas obovata, Strain CCMP722" /LENGTH=623 /DNA_ID=CAMNT_0006861269 /DNA_START=296 /DNA_END=2167 /DNA_ORIENTATION=+
MASASGAEVGYVPGNKPNPPGPRKDDWDGKPVAVPSTLDSLLFLSHSQDKEKFPIQFAIDDFQFLEAIAESKNSTVWLVNYRFANNLLVLKEINFKRFMKRHWVNLQREFISIQLNHKNILKTHGFFFLPNRVFFVLDYAKGGDLYQSLKREGPYSEERVLNIIHQLLEAVKHIHAQNIIHRDLKLDNILYSNTGYDDIKVADFGVCFPKTEFRAHPETRVGTLDYMAPEVIEHETDNGQIYDEKVDIWAIGIICYELLHGVPPFSNPNMEQTCFNIARAAFQISPELSANCVDFINNVLKKAPHNRPTIEEMQSHPWLRSNKTRTAPTRVIGSGQNKAVAERERDKLRSCSMQAEFLTHHIRCEILRRQCKTVFVLTDCPITRQLLSALLRLKQYTVMLQPTSSVETIASRGNSMYSEVYIVDVSAYNIQFIRSALRDVLNMYMRPILIALITITQQRQPDVLADLFDFYIHKPVERTQIDVFPAAVMNQSFENEKPKRASGSAVGNPLHTVGPAAGHVSLNHSVDGSVAAPRPLHPAAINTDPTGSDASKDPPVSSLDPVEGRIGVSSSMKALEGAKWRENRDGSGSSSPGSTPKHSPLMAPNSGKEKKGGIWSKFKAAVS